MAIEHQPGQKPAAPGLPPTWGEIVPEGQRALVIRFVLSDRVVTFPFAQLRRWEHAVGEPEHLLVEAGSETVVIEGAELAVVRAALDFGRLTEIRPNRGLPVRTGPRIHQLTLESD